MNVNDPIGDMLTRIRNAMSVRKREVMIPSSHIKLHIAEILRDEGYIEDLKLVEEDKEKRIRIVLKYMKNKSVIEEIKRCSKPGRREYVGKDSIPRVYQGLGIAILSTSQGVMSSRKARKLGIGGELLCTVF